MKRSTKSSSKISRYNDLLSIPGVGKSMAQDLIDLGITRVAQLRKRSPEKLYADLMELRGSYIDRCVLYVFRCAVYFSTTPDPDLELLKWWNWKDQIK